MASIVSRDVKSFVVLVDFRCPAEAALARAAIISTSLGASMMITTS